MKALMKTTKSVKPAEVEKKWHLIDAENLVVGRVATIIANILRGKHKPSFTPHVDCGDHVVVINADKVKFTGKKWQQKEYAHYTGYTRQRIVTAGRRLERNPERILSEAVRRMLPKNKLATKMLARLKIYSGTVHPHQAQQPEAREMGAK